MSAVTATTKQWLELAQGDSLSANHLLTLYPQPLEVIAYLCEQSVEKMLKAYLCAHECEIPRTHDLMKLNRLCQKVNPEIATIMEHCANLTPYGTQVRYPNHLELLDEDVKQAMSDQNAVSEFLLPRLQALLSFEN